MFELLITMLERLGIIVTIAFILTRFRFFRDMISKEGLNWKHRFTAILFFAAFGIIGTYTGVAFNANTYTLHPWANKLSPDEAIANFRVIGIVLAGMLGGYRIGLGAGLIAGLHRFTLGGFTAVPCSLASIIAGVLSGALHRKSAVVNPGVSLMIGSVAEALQMLIILLLAKPFDKALDLVSVIGVPMISANGLGAALFLLIIKSVVNEEQKAGALQAQKSLRIADQTLGYMRQGMTEESAAAVCGILYREMNASAVSMTNGKQILAHIGEGDDHHRPGSPIQTAITRRVLKEGRLVVAGHDELLCDNKDCILKAAIIAPLKRREDTIGTIKFYFHSEKKVDHVVLELVHGLSVLLSNQIELADADKANQLRKEAEIKVLQAQISPHFLFNSLNTIISLIRTNPGQARMLLVHLSHFLRQNLKGTTEHSASLETELKHVRAYLSIEEARFVNKLKVNYDIDETLLGYVVPPLTLQPIVENAVKHGMKDVHDNGVILIVIRHRGGWVEVSVSDNGGGMTRERLHEIGGRRLASEEGTGVGLYNVNRRLKLMFGEESALQVESAAGRGTTVTFLLPDKEMK
ncbi:sensor histidine kinase [Paenibacillus arenilitoris]|uniref:histidine kinase n=1 Tax=Paenibacillus arenilitoris TaxID=2772299 RepID=A0A927H536_9BACL|nr:sensor histidine kinase [Paenibacillus arenilitoris]MBD2868022.1 sensor histidine kinase [Paenibacillus arenilitoris]